MNLRIVYNKRKNMKKIVVFSSLIALFVWSFTFKPEVSSADSDGIAFQDIKFEEALKEAKSSNKLIFLDAYASWCGPCKWMEANTFKDDKVGAFFNENFINLKIDMEKGEGPELARRFKVTAYPTMFFINSKGEVVTKILGAKQPKPFLKAAEDILK